MKKPLFSLICAVALLFSSCSKENTTAPKDEKLYPVTFNLSTFSKEIVPMASLKKTVGQISASTASGTALNEAIQYIDYAVYNESGIKVNHKNSYFNNSNFGRIDDSLPKGKYKIVVAGSTGGVGSLPNDYYSGIYNSGTNGMGDIFLKQFELEVTGEPISQDVELKRIVGKIEIELADDIPASIEEIAYSVKGVGHYLYFSDTRTSSGQTVSKSNYYFDYPDMGVGPDYNQDFALYFFLQYDQDAIVSVNIRAYDNNRNLVVDKTINDVPVSINKKTILTGRLFDDVGSTKGQSFSISVDDKWNSESNHVEF